jgi:hypothetical protein
LPPEEAGNFKQEGQNQDGQGHHEHGYLGVRLIGEIGGLCWRDAGKQRASRHQGCGQRTKRSQNPNSLSPWGRRFLHGIDV